MLGLSRAGEDFRRNPGGRNLNTKSDFFGFMHIQFGYRCATEEYTAPSLLRRAIKAEKSGFDFLCLSDHFHPWFHRDGHACHPWMLMSTIAASTTQAKIGTGVTAPIYRYHPAIVAQAFATLGELFPQRVYLGLGTGEAMNEVPLGFHWPNFRVRFEMFKEAIEVIKLLWSRPFVDYDGRYFKLRKANLYVRPLRKVPIYIAASGKNVAKYAGREGDAFMTFCFKPNDLTIPGYRLLLNAVKEGAEEAGRIYADIPKMAEFLVSYDEDYEEALNSVLKWRSARIPNVIGEVCDPREMDRLAADVNVGEFERLCLITTDIEQCIEHAEKLIQLGFNEIQFHSSSPDEDEFLDEFSKKALPYLTDKHQETKT